MNELRSKFLLESRKGFQLILRFPSPSDSSGLPQHNETLYRQAKKYASWWSASYLQHHTLLLRVFFGRIRQKAQEEIKRGFLFCLKTIQLARSYLQYSTAVEAALRNPPVLGA